MRAQIPSRRKPKEPRSVSCRPPAPPSIEASVLEVLHCLGSATIEDLVQALPSYAWRQVFSAVDALRMKAILTVARPDESTYYISLRRAGHS
jgi:hypothetical protein